jgi:predicted DNA-binding transcriptional regulator AlpA
MFNAKSTTNDCKVKSLPHSENPYYLRIGDLADKYNMRPSTVYKRIKSGVFPKPIKDGWISYWITVEVDAYFANLPRFGSTMPRSRRYHDKTGGLKGSEPLKAV